MSVEQIGDGSPDGVQTAQGAAFAHGAGGGKDTVSTFGVYGATPVVQRAGNASLHQASWLSITSNASVAANIANFCAEVAATLAGLGFWV